MPIQIFIDGSAGTTGLRIVQRLAERAKTEPLTVRMLEGEQRKDLAARIDAINRSDVAFLCLPDAAAREIVPHIDPAVRVLDTSTAHRTDPAFKLGYLGGHAVAGGILQARVEISFLLEVEQHSHLLARIILEGRALDYGQNPGFSVPGLPAALHANGRNLMFSVHFHLKSNAPSLRI